MPFQPDGTPRTVEGLYEGLIEWIIRICGISAVIFVFAIFIFVFWEGKGLLFSENFSVWELLTSEKWDPTHEPASFGAARIILGTFSVAILAMTIAVPFSLGGAIFISEFCGTRLKEILKVVIELLAAIPSVVWGFIGLTIMSILIRDLGSTTGLSVLNGAIILALMSMPIILSISEDALNAVPDSYREAAIGLGVTRWQMVYEFYYRVQKRPAGCSSSGHGPRRWRDDGRADGYRACTKQPI